MTTGMVQAMRDAGISEEQIDFVLRMNQGQIWRVPEIKRDFAALQLQILADPCGDYKVLMRRYHVGKTFIYRVWAQRKKPLAS